MPPAHAKFGLATAHTTSKGLFYLGEFGGARKHCTTLLQKEPENTQAQKLYSDIDAGLRREGKVGLAIAGSALAVGIGALAWLLRKR